MHTTKATTATAQPAQWGLGNGNESATVHIPLQPFFGGVVVVIVGISRALPFFPSFSSQFH